MKARIESASGAIRGASRSPRWSASRCAGLHDPRGARNASSLYRPDARLRPHAGRHGPRVRGGVDRRCARGRRRQRARARVVAAVGQAPTRRRSSTCTASAGASATTCSGSPAGASSASTCSRSTTAASAAATATCPRKSQIYADARAAWNELARREPRAELRFIYGHSLGAAVALELGANVDNAAGVIAEAGFTSIADIVAESYAPLEPPGLAEVRRARAARSC